MSVKNIIVNLHADKAEIWGLSKREYVLVAIEALDQAGIYPKDFAYAYRNAGGNTVEILNELDLDTENSNRDIDFKEETT